MASSYPGRGVGRIPSRCRKQGVGPTNHGMANKAISPTLQKDKFSDFFFKFLESRFGSEAMDWAYTIFENIKLFRSNELMRQFYEILMEKVSLGLALHPLSPA